LNFSKENVPIPDVAQSLGGSKSVAD